MAAFAFTASLSFYEKQPAIAEGTLCLPGLADADETEQAFGEDGLVLGKILPGLAHLGIHQIDVAAGSGRSGSGNPCTWSGEAFGGHVDFGRGLLVIGRRLGGIDFADQHTVGVGIDQLAAHHNGQAVGGIVLPGEAFILRAWR